VRRAAFGFDVSRRFDAGARELEVPVPALAAPAVVARRDHREFAAGRAALRDEALPRGAGHEPHHLRRCLRVQLVGEVFVHAFGHGARRRLLDPDSCRAAPKCTFRGTRGNQNHR